MWGTNEGSGRLSRSRLLSPRGDIDCAALYIMVVWCCCGGTANSLPESGLCPTWELPVLSLWAHVVGVVITFDLIRHHVSHILCHELASDHDHVSRIMIM